MVSRFTIGLLACLACLACLAGCDRAPAVPKPVSEPDVLQSRGQAPWAPLAVSLSRRADGQGQA